MSRETCASCGRHWGVSTPPRTDVLCSDCARPTPDRNPAHYWLSRVSNFPSGLEWGIPGTPEWADARTSLMDLKIALEFAEVLGGAR